MIRVLYCGSSSACLELINDSSYDAPEHFEIYLNRVLQGVCEENVFSLYSLEPDTEYSVCIRFQQSGNEDTVLFRTETESISIDVRSFGAKGDGLADDTSAVQTAIHFLPPDGRLILPKGIYRTRPLALKSRMTLEICDGAVLQGIPDRTAYPVLPGEAGNGDVSSIFGTFEGVPKPMYQSLLSAQNAERISVIGPGIVDGNAQNSDFWTAFQTDPVARPRLVSFLHCKDVVLHGIQACNSPSWHIHPFHCENVSILNVSVQAPDNSPNTDAIDPEACDKVDIIGCRLSVGDDCIAIKSGKIELSRRFSWPADHHTVRNCLMERGHGAVTLGSEIAMGVRNLSVSQCRFVETDRGLRIKTRRGRGKDCDITDIAFDNLRMEKVLTPIVINMWYNCCDPDRFSEYVWSRDHLPVDERTPHLGSFRFTNMECTDASVAACYIDGLPEMPIDSVTFENVSISFDPQAVPGVPAMQNFAEKRCRLGLFFENVSSIRLENVTLKGHCGPGVIAYHCGTVVREGFTEEEG